MRPANACRSCRLHRRKCRAVTPAGSCERCVRLNIDCSNVSRLPPLDTVPQSRHLPNLQAKHLASQCAQLESNTPSAVQFPSTNDGYFRDGGFKENSYVDDAVKDGSFSRNGGREGVEGNGSDSSHLQTELVHLYFAHIHDKHHSLFHEPTIKAQLRDGNLPELLLHAMVALGSRFSDAPSLLSLKRRNRGLSSARRAVALFNMSDISVTTVQAAVLLGTISFADSNTEAEALYYAVANRLAQILDLAHRPTTNETERQVNLRIWWTLYMIDIWCSSGLHLPRQMQSTHTVQLPADEVVFLGLESRATSRPTTGGIWAQMANLAHIWADIYELNQSVIRETKDPQDLEEAVETLLKRLEMWSAVLPLSLRKTRSNLDYYASVGLGSAFAALHLGYHYYTEVLCYQFLADGASSANPDYAEKCKEHAKHFCDLLYLCLEIPNSKCLFVMVGHMLVVSSTVYIHTLMFSDLEDEITIARRRLEKNFQILMRLQSFWVKLDVSLSRLQAFHNACKISAEHSFGMDKWMLCFLLEHGVAVPERYPPTQIMGVTDSASPELTLQDWYSQTFSGG